MHKQIRGLMLLAFIFGTIACAPKNTVILVPNPDGSVGRISVANTAGAVEINQPNHFTTVQAADAAPSAPAAATPEKINSLFGAVLAAQPPAPVHFLLYFDSDSTRLTTESEKTLEDVVQSIQTQQSRHISVVGHCDTLGDKAYNLLLSRRRADRVKKLLVSRGIDADYIETTSHGELHPIVKTGDNVSNPVNRRVEVVIR